MNVELAYGRHGLHVDVPEDAVVIRPVEVPGLPDEAAAIDAALAQPIAAPGAATVPLRDLVKPTDRVVVVFSDITRPMPSDRALPPLLRLLDGVVPREQITLLNGLGTHRANSPEELEGMLGRDIVNHYRVAQSDAWATDDLVDLGRTRFGHRAVVNRQYLEADVRILTGFIEPHLFAGFSGGPKAVLPGIAGIDAIMDNHGYAMLNHPQATWGQTEGNPVWEEMREVALMTRPSFLLNVTLNRHRQITGVFAGDMVAAHRAGVEAVRRTAMVGVEAPFDVVLTTNSGYPLDINLYQAVKGMSAAAQIVKQGGDIVIAAECRDGVPDYGEYRRLVHEGGSLQGIIDLISQPSFHCHDQWEAQLQVQVQQKATVYVHSSYLPDDEVRGMLFEPCHDVEATVVDLLRRHGPGARLCVLPEGPQTIPYLA